MSIVKRERKKKAVDPKIKFEEGDNLTNDDAKNIALASEERSIEEVSAEMDKRLKEIVDRKTKSDDTRRKVPAIEWKVAAAKYETGMYELDDIAEMLGVARITVSKRFSETGVKKGASEKYVEQAIREKVLEAHFITADENNTMYAEMQRDDFKYIKLFKEQIVKAIVHAIKTTGSAAAAKEEVNTLSKAIEAISKGHDTGRIILNRKEMESVTVDQLPYLEMRFMSPEEQDAIANQTNSEEFALGALHEPVIDYDADIIEEFEDDDI